ncbi:putative RDD family membrane protein YckC [Streptomonospora nanhaiensis]|uniref:Putative RDD family membrane protein YckC n=1 Tax=Streptomonospora nanhaiensis TaxID=1323731 RepID=A0A853BWM9_9ACTN|nr:RDD family protein [Streptomonospora nanhaiensis]NYI98881.1 putative RDD family membrane protein YckC [Streptomonospora nanhaiensis]
MSYPPPYDGAAGSPRSAPHAGGAGAPSGHVPPYPGPDGPLPHAAAPPPYPGPDGPAAAPPRYPAAEGPAAVPLPHEPLPPYRPVPGGAGPAADPSGRRPLADWWRRVWARVIDGVAVTLPIAVLGFIVSLTFAGAQALSGGFSETSFSIVYGIVTFVLSVVYETVCVKRWRRTLGMHLMGLEVAPVRGAGRPGPIPVLSMIARASVLNLPTLVSYSTGWTITVGVGVILACYLWPLWDRPNRQGLHDKIAATVVVRTD